MYEPRRCPARAGALKWTYESDTRDARKRRRKPGRRGSSWRLVVAKEVIMTINRSVLRQMRTLLNERLARRDKATARPSVPRPRVDEQASASLHDDHQDWWARSVGM